MYHSIPTIELLERTHAFPCPYLFKIIGKAEQDFPARVADAIRSEFPVGAEPQYRLREAVGGRHVAVTFEPTMQSALQVLAVYRRLVGLEGVMFVF